MSLHFVAGSSGSGKSYTVYQKIIEQSIAHPEQQFLIIVPEQFTMQTQKEVLEMHPQKGLLNVDILSFNRLAYRVFEETGGNTLPVLEETGKSLVIQRVVTEVQSQLQVLGRTLSHTGAVAQMKSLISELMQYRVRPEDLDAWLAAGGGRMGGRLSLKIEDIRLIYAAFHHYIEDHYLTAEEVPQVLCDVIADARLVRGSVIVFDGFTGFTPVQHQVVRELLSLASQVTLVMTVDSPWSLEHSRSEQSLFHMTGEMYRKALEMATELRIPIAPVVWIEAGEQSRFAHSPRLQHLEQSLFRFGSRTYAKTEQEADASLPEICITECANPEEEILLVAQRMQRMVRECGYHYRDFAIVAGELDTYGRAAVNCLEQEGIPYFLDQKKAVMTNPMVEFIRAALDMVAQNYSYDSVFRFLRTNLTPFRAEEIDEMENYVRALGIKGRSRYENSWTRCSRNIEPEKLPYFNELRSRFVELTEALHAGLHERNSSARRKSEVLYAFLVKLQMQEQMEAYADSFREAGDLAKAKEFDQIYAQIMELLDKLVEVLGSEHMKLTEYQAVLDAGFQETQIGLIPPGEDQVLIGDIERTRLKKIRTLFFVGINEGNIPKPAAAKGILSELDRDVLRERQVVLAPSSREQMYQQRFYLYLNLTKPSEHLFLSYCTESSKGEAKLPSYLIGVISKLFPDLTIAHKEDEAVLDLLETRAGQREYLIGELQRLPELPSKEAWELLRYRYGQEATRETVESLLDAAAARNNSNGISAELARKLYAENLLRVSVSELEEFVQCEFRHFLEFGLRLKERDEYAFTPTDFGTVMHAALEKYSKLVRERKLRWGEISVADQHAMADDALEDVFQDDPTQILHSTSRNRHMVERMRTVLYRTVWAMDTQLAHGRFQPSDFEFRITDELETVRFSLGEGVQMKLYGRVDRLDTCSVGDTQYLKVVDYKTGQTKLDLGQLYHGLQLQLAVYLNAAVEAEQKSGKHERVEPAAIFYYHIEDPILEKESANVAEEILNQLKPDGLVRAEREVLELLDEELHEGVSSKVIPVAMNKDGALAAKSKAADLDQFRLLQAFTRAKIQELGEQIIQGKAKSEPYRMKQGSQTRSGCDYCAYGGVCGFDVRVPDNDYQAMEDLTREEALQKIAETLQYAAGTNKRHGEEA